MPYIQHTAAEQDELLRAIGVQRIEDLFEAIPESIRLIVVSICLPGNRVRGPA